MHLKTLQIQGFKSFARKGELEFTAPITSIVGPNGSGKSNVAEAFRFVLGEQSVKSMRGKRGEDLIFSGSDQVSKANRASVTVTLDNSTGTFPVDFEEVVVERVVHRDGLNEYSVNGSKVRLKDVQSILASANIGSTGHHIISQGEADRVLRASPKERREMIEDALGLKVYQYKKQESQKKLTKTLKNIEQVESLRLEVKPHLQYLERQVKKLERSIQLRDELKNSYLEYLYREDIYLGATQDSLREKISEPEAELTRIQNKLDTAKELLESTRDTADQEEIEKAKTVLQDAEATLRSVQQECSKYEGQIAFIERNIKEEKSKPVPAKTALNVAQVEEFEGLLEKHVSKHEELSDISLLQRSLRDCLHLFKKFTKSSEGTPVSEGITKLEDQLTEIKHRQRKVRRSLEEATKAEQKAREQYDSVLKKTEEKSLQNREAEREVFSLTERLREIDLVRSRLRHEEEIVERERTEFKRELQEAVTLLGRFASHYLTYGKEELKLNKTTIIEEKREVQHDRRRSLEKLKIRLEETGTVDEDVEKEYKEVKERDEFLQNEIKDLNSSVANLNSLIKELENDLNEQFKSGITKISVEFKKFFTLMFGGGDASLNRVMPPKRKNAEEEPEINDDEENDNEEGVEIEVKLPQKRVQGLDMLSGGERALTSIALIFAMSQVNPPLFIILDETDAALDEANSRRYGDMIEALAQKSQLILITHNRETMSRAGVLYGVTMSGDGISKLLSVQLDEAVAVAK